MRLKSPTYVKPRELEEYEYILGVCICGKLRSKSDVFLHSKTYEVRLHQFTSC